MRIVSFIATVLSVVFFLSGCVGVLPKISGYVENGIEGDGSDLVELKNGTVIKGSISKDNLWETIVKKETGSITINEQKFSNSEVIAYQHKRKYYRKNHDNYFCVRIVKGHINVYQKRGEGTGSNGSTFSFYRYYLQKGSGTVENFEKKLLASMVADSPEASHWLADGVFKKKKQDYYFNQAISTYNTK